MGLGFEGKGALGGDKFMVYRADLHEAGGSVRVEYGAVGVVARSEFQSEVVVVESSSVILGLEETITLFFELVSAAEEKRGVEGAVSVGRGGGGGLARGGGGSGGGEGGGGGSGRYGGGGGVVFLLSAAGFSHC